MVKPKIIIQLFAQLLVLALLASLCACVHSRQATRFINPDLPADQYAVEINKQHKALKIEKDTAKKATICYNLALLYLSYRNPNNNYPNAQKYLIKAGDLDKTIAENYEVKNVLHMLNAMNRISFNKDTDLQRLNKMLKSSNDAASKLKRKYEKCIKDNKKCVEDNIRLIKENVDLKLSIERLKKLDLEIEEKRKRFK